MFVNVLSPRSECHNGGVSDELVLVLSTPSVLEGEIARSRLEDEGIPVLLKGGGSDPYGIGPVHVFVPADHEVQARLVLEWAPDTGAGSETGSESAAEEPEGR